MKITFKKHFNLKTSDRNFPQTHFLYPTTEEEINTVVNTTKKSGGNNEISPVLLKSILEYFL